MYKSVVALAVVALWCAGAAAQCSALSCGDCIGQGCIWCSDSSSCIDGGFGGGGGCTTYYYTSCSVSGKVVIALISTSVAIVVIGIFLIMLKTICCPNGRCCARSDRPEDFSYVSLDEEVAARRSERDEPSRSDERRRQMSEKYGIDY